MHRGRNTLARAIEEVRIAKLLRLTVGHPPLEERAQVVCAAEPKRHAGKLPGGHSHAVVAELKDAFGATRRSEGQLATLGRCLA